MCLKSKSKDIQYLSGWIKIRTDWLVTQVLRWFWVTGVKINYKLWGPILRDIHDLRRLAITTVDLRRVINTSKFFSKYESLVLTPSNRTTIDQKNQMRREELSLIREQSRSNISQILKGFYKVVLSLEQKIIEYIT
jgi:hypothetical protein